ncbi:MAG: fibronectin type III domain-containing protein [Nitrospira sp.]|nr:fibronectin type III domain-containing protein [Nitrospira sp.]
MRANMNLIDFCYRLFTKSTAGLILLGVIALPLPGCGEQDGGGPVISSLSAPGDDQAPVENRDESNLDSSATDLSTDDDQAMGSPGHEAEDSELFANVADPAEEDNPEITLTPTPTGVTAQLTWDPSTDPNVLGYFIHYGKQSPGEYGSCSYEQSQRVGHPPATITDLDPNTPYFFAISAFGEAESEEESPCSNEVLLITPPAQT